MPVPTLAAVRKHPMAVLIYQRDSDTDELFDKNFEWFNEAEAFTKFATEADAWASGGVRSDKSWEILLVGLKDTATLEIESVVAYGFDTARTKVWADGVIADVETLFKKPPRKDATEIKEEAYKVEADVEVAKPRVVKSRRKSAAAVDVDTEEEDAPVPAVKRKATKPKPVFEVPEGAADEGPAAKNLRAALRAKGAAMLAKQDAAESPDVDEATE